MPMVASRRLAAEFLGTCLLLAAVVGSGVMADRLAGGNGAVALLCNSIATGAALVVLIAVFKPISGAHLNPAISSVAWLRGELAAVDALGYAVVQVAGAIAGVFLAHAMFDLPLLQASTTARHGMGQWISEIVATFGLVLVIAGSVRFRPENLPMNVGLYITSAYWFTASTSFANPAVTVARSFTNTYSGIAPADVAMFVAAQLIGATAGFAASRLFFAAD